MCQGISEGCRVRSRIFKPPPTEIVYQKGSAEGPPQADARGQGVSPSFKIPPRLGDTGG
jgi:hypothetical protein